MPLDRYHEKRDFERTPEPPGGSSDTPGRAFVIQKHAATRLHYDVRLQVGEVLASWAVPKGPSMDPHEKRLAVHVEDHPLEYGSFEGSIPAGEYGGGTVMVWDRGTYEPLEEFDTAYAERRPLKFALHGAKLTGRFTLIPMKPRAGDKGDNWLLIKERDEHVRPAEEFSVTEAMQLSAATGRTLEQIAAGAPEAPYPPDPGAPATGAVVLDRPPADAAFQLATLASHAPGGPDWLHEVKYDGYRLRAVLDGTARILTRNGVDWTDRFSRLADAVESLPATSAMIDGEAVVLDPRGVSDFGALQQAVGSDGGAGVRFMAFDLLYLNSFDLRDLPLLQRKELLSQLLAGHEGPVQLVEHVIDGGEQFHAMTCELELEGSVSKRADRPYVGGRSRDWLKTKCLSRQEFVVVGWTDPRASREGFGALLLAINSSEGLRYAGRVGTGFDAGSLREIHGQLLALGAEQSPLAGPMPRGAATVHWVRPELVAEVTFREWTRQGLVRQASFRGLRLDRSPESIVRETAVVLTNPDKILYADTAAGSAGITKLDLARYYEIVAAQMLVHVARRPLTLVRCPHGEHGGCFYQKHPGKGLPPELRTFELDEHGTPQRYVYVDSVDGLLALVQLGALEIHAWNSLTEDPERPDRIVLDLDPAPDVSWDETVSAAVLIRDALAALGLVAFAKTTGGKGVHVVVPIVPQHDHGTVRALARSFVDILAAHEPGRFTARMAKAARPGKIFVDYLRNAHGATAVAAFSTRARPGAPVAVPVTWQELEAGLDPLAFDTRTVPERLASLGSDPWDDYEQSRTALEPLHFAALGVVLQPELGGGET